MKEIDKLILNNQQQVKISDYVLNRLEELKNNEAVEGIFYSATDFFGPTITVTIIHNKPNYVLKELSSSKKEEILETTKVDYREECYPIWWYEEEFIKDKRYDYPIESALYYGDILFDRNGELSNLKQVLENRKEEFAYTIRPDLRELEKPIEYTKK